jgi:hypothetical protein
LQQWEDVMSRSPVRFAQPTRMPLPLPDLPTEPRGTAVPDDAQVPQGCYLLLVSPARDSSPYTMHGTCRVDRLTGHVRASGDLYSCFDKETGETVPTPDPGAGIPVFAIRHHRYYLRVTEFVAEGGGFTMVFKRIGSRLRIGFCLVATRRYRSSKTRSRRT